MKRWPAIRMAVLAFAAAACADVVISESEARDIGAKALSRYCDSHKLSAQSFRLMEIGPSGDVPWELVYVSSGLNPQREIAVAITKKGRVEIATDFEGRDEQKE